MVLGFGRRPSSPVLPAANKLAVTKALVSHELADLHSDDEDTQTSKRLAPAAFAMKNTKMDVRLKNRSVACVDLVTEVDAPHDLMFDLLADPAQHERIFDSIESATSQLVEQNGPIKKWRLDYKARWKFWKLNGVCDNRLWMTTNRDAGTVHFELREPGFLKTYEGMWTITGPHGGGPGVMNAGRVSSCGSSISGSSRTSSNGIAMAPFGSAKDAEASTYSGMFSRGLAGFLAAITNPFIALDHQISPPEGSGMSVTSSPPSTPSRSASFSISGRSPTKIHITKQMCPKITPPYPISLTLKSQVVGQVDDMLTGLLAATGRALQVEREADLKWQGNYHGTGGRK